MSEKAEWPAPGAPARAEKPPLGEPRPAVTYEITGRVYEALRAFLREHRKSPDEARYLFVTFWELRAAIEADLPDLLEPPTASPS